MKRVVVKVGTHVLSDQNRLSKERMSNLVEFLVALMEKYEVILVSSAAIAAGYSKLKIDKGILNNRQALAAIGQPFLMEAYNKILSKHKKLGAQVLITAQDFDSRKKTKHAKNLINTLLANDILPIINENDATATEELVVGDNDQLSAYMTKHTNSDLLIILSDIDAYYDEDPHKNPNAKVQKVVKEIDECALSREATPHGTFATGGIVTKLKAASYLLKNDINMFLASGFDLSDAKSYMLGGKHMGGTLFCRGEA